MSKKRTFGWWGLNVRFGIERGHSAPGFALTKTETFPEAREDFLILSQRAEAKPPLTLLLARANNLRSSMKITSSIVLEHAPPVNRVYFLELAWVTFSER